MKRNSQDVRVKELEPNQEHYDTDLPLNQFQEIVGYRFQNPRLLKMALTHRSLLNEAFDEDLQDNERLEFLGDAVLGMLTAEWLMEEFPDFKEGELTRLRSALVKEDHLAKIARRWSLGKYLYLGRGEEQMKGREKDSLLANAFEAMIAAIYLDGGLDAVRETIRTHLNEIVLDLKGDWKGFLDPKTTLQEVCINMLRTQPMYKVVEETGPDHQKTFTVELHLFFRSQTRGTGKSKKEAEQQAAALLLERLQRNPFGLL